MSRFVGFMLLAVTLSTTLAGCYIRDERGCRGRWEREHRDERGRWHRGRCW